MSVLERSDLLKSEHNKKFLIYDISCCSQYQTTQHQVKKKVNDLEVGIISFEVLSCYGKPRL